MSTDPGALIKYLKYKADTHRCSDEEKRKITRPPSQPRDVRRISRLVEVASRAATEPPTEKRIKQFTDMIQRYTAEGTDGLDNRSLRQMILTIFNGVSSFFFFSLPSRAVRDKAGNLERLVKLKVYDRSARHDSYGAYYPGEDSLRMWLRWNHGEPNQEFRRYFGTVVHEMVHAYIDIFSDPKHPKHDKYYNTPGGHGIAFWLLLLYITKEIYHLTRCREIKHEMRTQKFEIHEQIREYHLPKGCTTCFKGCSYGCDSPNSKKKQVSQTEPTAFLDKIWKHVQNL